MTNAFPERLRIAVIGTGLAWAPHRQALLELGEVVDVAWLVGQSLDRVGKEAAHFPGATATTDLGAVLADRSVRAAIVLTPPSTHDTLVCRLAERGIHVLLEKPLALDTTRAESMLDACERHGVRLGVVLQHRYRPASVRLKQLLDEGALGTLTRAAVDARWWRPQSYFDEPGRGTRARDGGGVLMTQAIHTLDLFLHLAGPVAEVAAIASTSAAHQMECEDVVAGIARMHSGAVATLHATTAAYPGFPDSIDISGALGTARLVRGELAVDWLDGRGERFGQEVALGSGNDPMAFSHAAHKALIEDFLLAAQTGSALYCDGRSALAVHRLIDALLASSATRQFRLEQ